MRFLILFLLLFTNPAHATPPRVLTIHDQPVANSAEHLFLIRTVADNIGLHQASLTHRFLVRQNLKSGAVDKHWPLRHLLVLDDWINIQGNPQHTIELHEPPEANGPWERWRARNPIQFFNPYHVLREVRASPLSPFNPDNAHNRQMSWALSPKYGLVSGVPQEVYGDERNFFTAVPMDVSNGLPEEAETILKPDRVRKIVTASLLPTLRWLRKQTPPTESKVDPMSFNKESLPLALDLCQVRETVSLPVTGGKNLVSIDCEGDEEVARFRIWLPL